jgi:hypothetical protein
VRRILEFEADLPDDQVEENGEIIQFGGRLPTEILREALASQDWSVGPIVQHSDNVWCFDMVGSFGKATVHFCDIKPKYVATLKRRAWLEDLLGRSDGKFRETLGSLECAVRALGGKKLAWFKTYDAADKPRSTIDEVMRA